MYFGMSAACTITSGRYDARAGRLRSLKPLSSSLPTSYYSAVSHAENTTWQVALQLQQFQIASVIVAHDV